MKIQHIKLSDLTKKVEEAIKNTFGSEFYWIVAEISTHKFYPNNDRHYFEFIEKVEGEMDPVAKVKGVSWQSGSQCIKLFEKDTGQVFTNGVQVLVKVKVEYQSAFGLQLVLLDIDSSFTLGNLEKQRRETLERLVKENPDSIKKIGEEYFTKNKAIKLNAVIQNIAIIGSPNSEGYTDFTHTITNNQFHYKFAIDIYQSSVQGMEAEKELVNKLVFVFQNSTKYDCVVIIRGGGAKTDFLVFDTYNLARAVARFPIPIITGLGHHKDVSVVDLMVHTSTKTPTKAAEFIISHNRAFEDSIQFFKRT
ncbi:MAG TPA: exodeoxyribonuclease VII large subunit [Bacteroidia bacterium]|jgi:exodeoxyribonuclease VII large subunit